MAPRPEGHGEGIVQTTNAETAAAKAEVVRKSASRKECGFESRRPHQALLRHPDLAKVGVEGSKSLRPLQTFPVSDPDIDRDGFASA